MPGPAGRSLGEVVSDIAGNLRQIMRAEIRLAKAELREDAAGVKRGLVCLAAGACMGTLAAAFALLAAMHALATVMAPWAAAAIVAAAACLAAAWFIGAAVKRIRQVGLPRTTATVQESVQWAKMRAR